MGYREDFNNLYSLKEVLGRTYQDKEYKSLEKEKEKSDKFFGKCSFSALILSILFASISKYVFNSSLLLSFAVSIVSCGLLLTIVDVIRYFKFKKKYDLIDNYDFNKEEEKYINKVFEKQLEEHFKELENNDIEEISELEERQSLSNDVTDNNEETVIKSNKECASELLLESLDVLCQRYNLPRIVISKKEWNTFIDYTYSLYESHGVESMYFSAMIELIKYSIAYNVQYKCGKVTLKSILKHFPEVAQININLPIVSLETLASSIEAVAHSKIIDFEIYKRNRTKK